MENIQYLLLIVGQLFCAYRAIAAKRILPATLYLAGVSAMTAGILYTLGAHYVAVIELSVGAGLVTVLLLYGMSVVGDDALDPTSVIPKPLAFTAVVIVVILLGGMAYPLTQQGATPPHKMAELTQGLWQQRVLDVYIQVALVFAGVLGVLGLLSEQAPFWREKYSTVHSEIPETVMQVEELQR
jgi:NADH:ubiquinone oxidoreductase subunit 6 (subunit J)